MKIIILAFIFFILLALGSALFSLIRHKEASTRTVRALTIRILLSVALFLLLLLSVKMGWIHPHGVHP